MTKGLPCISGLTSLVSRMKEKLLVPDSESDHFHSLSTLFVVVETVILDPITPQDCAYVFRKNKLLVLGYKGQ